ncbi:MAG: hypothetical protein VW894_05875 [Gammaproteobacteria bacterium]
MTLKFEPVIPTDKQIKELYTLLKHRAYSISHTSRISLKDHYIFVKENPYLAWYLIYLGTENIGSTYLQSDNSIGIDLVDPNSSDLNEIIFFIKKNHQPLKPIKSIRRGDFFMNVAPDNLKLLEILQEIGKIEIQRTFSL